MKPTILSPEYALLFPASYDQPTRDSLIALLGEELDSMFRDCLQSIQRVEARAPASQNFFADIITKETKLDVHGEGLCLLCCVSCFREAGGLHLRWVRFCTGPYDYILAKMGRLKQPACGHATSLPMPPEGPG